MATAKEMRLRPGEVVVYASASITRLVAGLRGSISCPLDTPGSILRYGVMRVEEVETTAKQGLGTSTKGVLLETNDPPELPRIGGPIEIWEGFRNFVSEGDERLSQELRNSGWQMRVGYTEEGQQRVTLQRVPEQE